MWFWFISLTTLPQVTCWALAAARGAAASQLNTTTAALAAILRPELCSVIPKGLITIDGRAGAGVEALLLKQLQKLQPK